MKKYSVSFVVKEWVTISVRAENEQAAMKEAEALLKRTDYVGNKITINDWNIKYAGIILDDVVNSLDK